MWGSLTRSHSLSLALTQTQSYLFLCKALELYCAGVTMNGQDLTQSKPVLALFQRVNTAAERLSQPVPLPDMLSLPLESSHSSIPTSSSPATIPVRNHCATCGICEGGVVKLSICSKCKAVRYCSVQCQKADWTTHKSTCKTNATNL